MKRRPRLARVAGIVPAAGRSSRLGANKLLLELDSEALVRRAVRQALDGGLSPVIAVLGFEAERVAAALAGLPVETVINPLHSSGMHGSLATGIGSVPADCEGALVLLPDMPLVTAAMLRQMVDRFRAGAEPLVISRFGDVQAPPTLYARHLFPEVAAAGPGGGRRVVRDHLAEAAVIHWPETLLADLDHVEDLDRIRTLMGQAGPKPQGR